MKMSSSFLTVKWNHVPTEWIILFPLLCCWLHHCTNMLSICDKISQTMTHNLWHHCVNTWSSDMLLFLYPMGGSWIKCTLKSLFTPLLLKVFYIFSRWILTNWMYEWMADGLTMWINYAPERHPSEKCFHQLSGTMNQGWI